MSRIRLFCIKSLLRQYQSILIKCCSVFFCHFLLVQYKNLGYSIVLWLTKLQRPDEGRKDLKTLSDRSLSQRHSGTPSRQEESLMHICFPVQEDAAKLQLHEFLQKHSTAKKVRQQLHADSVQPAKKLQQAHLLMLLK